MYPWDQATPAVALARVHLVHPRIHIVPNILPEWMARGIATSGVGLDHVEGERIVAVGNDSLGNEFDEFFVLTDRRLAGRCGDNRFSVPLYDIIRADCRAGVIERSLHVLTGGAAPVSTDATVPAFVQPLGALLDVLARIPPVGRVPAPEPLCVQSAEDPTGAATALGSLGLADARFELLLHFIDAQHRAGRLEPGAGADLVARIVLHYRTTWAGRGMRDGRWLSPLWAADLANAFARILGTPVRAGDDRGWLAYDFHLRGESDTGAAVAESAVGLAALAVIGIGWVRVPSRSVHEVRVHLLDHPAPPSFVLSEATSGAPLSENAPALVRSILGALLERELATLTRRCVLGWGLAPTDLFAQPPQAVADGLFHALGHVDLAPLAHALS